MKRDFIELGIAVIVSYVAVAMLTGVAWLANAAMILAVLAKTVQVGLRERRKG